MSKDAPGPIETSVGIAKAILHDRTTRRRLLARSLLLSLALMAIGLWLIDAWLKSGVLRFALWWGSCAMVTIFVMLFALYDALAVIREEKAKLKDLE